MSTEDGSTCQVSIFVLICRANTGAPDHAVGTCSTCRDCKHLLTKTIIQNDDVTRTRFFYYIQVRFCFGHDLYKKMVKYAGPIILNTHLWQGEEKLETKWQTRLQQLTLSKSRQVSTGTAYNALTARATPERMHKMHIYRNQSSCKVPTFSKATKS